MSGGGSRDRSQEKESVKAEYSSAPGKRRFTEGSPSELKPDIAHQESSLITASKDPLSSLIKAEKEEILPDSTEDVTVSLKQEDAEHELNTIAKSIDTKQKTNPMNSSLNNEEKTGNTDLYRQLYFNSSFLNKIDATFLLCV